MNHLFRLSLVVVSLLIVVTASAQRESNQISLFLDAEGGGHGEIRIDSGDIGDFSLSKTRIELKMQPADGTMLILWCRLNYAVLFVGFCNTVCVQ